jgi:4-hydroxy-2-oxoheptanedioate aldolase
VSARIGSSISAELLARAGFDYVTLDAQHGEVSFETLMEMIRAVEGGGSTPLVRVPAKDAWMIQRALDLGGHGVVVPGIDDAEQCRAAVAACRYPPLGERSYGPLRWRESIDSGEALCIVQIETAAGLSNTEAIVSVPGLDGVYIGPVDLGLSLGLGRLGTFEHPRIAAAIVDTVEACARHGVMAGRPALTIGEVGAALQEGCRFVTAALDTDYMRMGAGDHLSAIRQRYSLSE